MVGWLSLPTPRLPHGAESPSLCGSLANVLVKSCMKSSVANRKIVGAPKTARSSLLPGRANLGQSGEARPLNGMWIHGLPDIAGAGRVGVPTTVVAMSVSHCTTPLNFDMPALTLTMPA